ncbi:Crp/Fnr family transcriptional regulator [Paraburkholderia sp. BR13439]|uniref:Crp/Fnr family transcriptional regulator n=1 Tax=Paraburkholderia TaxID=1822464 RepID=UPI0034CD4099
MEFSAPLVEKMSANPWFSSLPLAERESLVASSTRLRIDSGSPLFRRGDPPDGFYGLVEGRLKASNVRSDGKEGILVILEPGNWFAQMSAVTGWPYAYSVTALETAHLLRLPLEAFNSFMQRAAFAKAIAELQCQHTALLYQMLDDATLHATRTRIARRLMRLARGDATQAAENRSDIPVSQETLAMMLGLSRQTLALELKEMAAQGAVALRYGHVEIISMDVLKSFDD